MRSDYKLQVRHESTYSIVVFKLEDKFAIKEKKKIEWILDLEGDAEPIIFCELFDPTKFLVMNWNGWLRAYDIETKTKIFDRDFNCEINCKALLNKWRNRLYVAAEPYDEAQKVVVFDLPSLEEIEEYELPREVNVREMSLLEGNRFNFLFYDANENYSMKTLRSVRFSHGFHVFDPASKSLTYRPLPSPPKSSISHQSPMINTDRALAVIKDWEDVEVKVDKDGNRLFVQKLIVIDMNNLEILYHFPVREFYAYQLDRNEEESLKIADILEQRKNTGHNTDEYDEALTQFNETLCSTHIDSDQEFIWITWEGGIVRRMFINGKYKSPLLVPKELSHSKVQDAFGVESSHTTFVSGNFDQVILNLEGDKKIIDVSEIELVNEGDEWLPVDLQPYLDEIDNSDQKEIERILKEQEFIIIENPNESTNKWGCYDCLEEIARITADLDKYRRGHTLKFLFRFSDGVEMDEKEFFMRAVKVEYTYEIVETIIKNFTSYKDASHLYASDEDLALCYAVHYFSCSFESCLDLAFRYLSVVDFQHEVYCCETFIPELFYVYKNTKHYPKLLLMAELLDDSDVSRTFLYREFLDTNSVFRQWFDNGGKEQIPSLLDELSEYGFEVDLKVGPSSISKLDGLKELMDCFYGA
ncbi:hypothetical protein V6R21_09965 [Limibacter armeniacum]|uniref:hypothetical protein n=1 Tax=Limibacter armeniacum TaxID=466084 RepID=UPI002FE5B8E6